MSSPNYKCMEVLEIIFLILYAMFYQKIKLMLYKYLVV